MRSHAKASSAHSTQRQAGGLGRIGTACFAACCLAAFLGSGAPAASAADNCPNAKYRVGLAASLPDCRAYEKVTPADKNDTDISDANGPALIGFQETFASEDGNRAVYASAGPGGDPEGAAVVTQFRTERTPAGWLSVPLTPPVDSGAASTVFWELGFSRDLSFGLFSGPTKNGFDQSAPVSMMDLGDRAIAEIFPKIPGNLTFVKGMADDLSHVLFETTQALTPGSPPGLSSYLYDYTGGQLEYVGILPGGATSPDPVESAIGPDIGLRWRNTMSADGKRTFFLTPKQESGSAQLYVREGNTTTKRVSAPDPDAPPPSLQPQEPVFVYASRDGRYAFFTSAEKLTADSTAYPCDCPDLGRDLYRYDVESGDLVDITVDSGDPFGAQVMPAVGGAANGSRVYFAAHGKLTPDAPPALPSTSASVNHLYEWHDDGTPDGELHYVATSHNGFLASSSGTHGAYVSENGRYFGWLEDEPPPAVSRTLRVYDAVTHTSICLSCVPDVDTWAEFTRGWNNNGGNPTSGSVSSSGFARKPRNILDDGTVFFETNAGLLPEDTNGAFDVYEYKDGEHHLLSSGAGTSNDTYFSDATADGRDVFLTTREPLVASDEDELTDLYDVREGGGLDEDLPHPPLPSCNGEGCRGTGSAAPSSKGAGTASFEGPGNRRQARARCAKGKRRVTRRGQGRCVKKTSNHKRRDAKHNRRTGR